MIVVREDVRYMTVEAKMKDIYVALAEVARVFWPRNGEVSVTIEATREAVGSMFDAFGDVESVTTLCGHPLTLIDDGPELVVKATHRSLIEDSVSRR